ncbi:MAG: glycosyltransferase [Pirellulales bacterium]|nr:glycosyltransferase [Pirellulales bacterium]
MPSSGAICQLLHSLTVGGAEVLAAELGRKLGPRHRFVFFCLEELGTLGRQLKEEGFTVEVIGRRPGIDFTCARQLRRLWQRHRIRLVHAHQYTPFFYTLAARLGTGSPPVLFTEHGRFYPDYPRKKRILFNRLLLRRRDRVVGVGRAVCQALVRNEGIPQRRVELIYNGVDLDRIAQAGDQRDSVRAELGVSPEDLVLIQVARLDHLKDHCTAIRTIDRVAKQAPGARLFLVGEGPELRTIESEIRARHLESHVRLLGLRQDVPRLLAGADVFLLSSISEGIPVTLIEAMAAGLPVVATNVGGVGEVVEAGQTGLLASSGNDVALAEAVMKLAGDAGLRQEMGKRGRARAEAVFSERQMHAAYERCYEEMLRG